jgi:hypothetical protein
VRTDVPCERTMTPAPDSSSERGSALLIVLLFAAIVAIALYREVPVVVTEAKRQQEDVLVYRGMQYQRAIQLYYRKMGRYPPTIDALENTNRIRFLRRRYKDPLTGEDNWRLIHMSLGGPIDSLIKPLNGNGNGQPFGQNASNQDGFGQGGFGQGGSSQSGFGQSGLGQSGFGQNSTPQNNSQPDPNAPLTNPQNGLQADPSPYPPRRGPAVSAAGADGEGGGAQSAQLDPATGQPVFGEKQGVPPQATGTAATFQFDAQAQLQAGGQNGQAGAGGPAGLNSNTAQQGAGQPGQPGVATAANANQPGVDPNSSVANQILRTAGPTITPQQPQAQPGPVNPFSAGSLGGVASRGKGHAIKVINDQTDYAKWEFIYDYRKDTGAGGQGSLGVPAVNGPQSNPNTFTPTPQPVGPAPATITNQ